ncbi:MAG: hypothetical protein LKE59_11165 [Eubacterium sp.]|jgi:hypothetical protein|nr:hypothetical protein [Eubacterium sp.]MCH4078713.1 hypothetical protein [Eubacterium sp.]
MRNVYQNSEGYSDPTASIALSHVAAEEKKKRYRPLVYIVSRYAGDIQENVNDAKRYCRFAVNQGAIPVCSHLLYPQFLKDDDPNERRLGLFFGKLLMDKCDQIWIFSDGDYSSGMQTEYNRAIRRRRTIRYFTTDCHETGDPKSGGNNESL